MSIVRLIYVTVQPNQVKDAVSLWKNHCAPLRLNNPVAYRKNFWNVSTRPGNSFRTRSGIARQTSTATVKVKRTQKSRNTRVPCKVERRQ